MRTSTRKLTSAPTSAIMATTNSAATYTARLIGTKMLENSSATTSAMSSAAMVQSVIEKLMNRARREATPQLRAGLGDVVGRRLPQAVLHPARPVHDAGEAVRQHAQHHADARQQEDRRECELDRVRDVDDLY